MIALRCVKSQAKTRLELTCWRREFQGGEIRRVFLQIPRQERRQGGHVFANRFYSLIFLASEAEYCRSELPHYEMLIDSHQKKSVSAQHQETGDTYSFRLRDPFILLELPLPGLESLYNFKSLKSYPPIMSRPEDTLYVTTAPP